MSVQRKGRLWYVVLEDRDAITGKRVQRWISTGSTRKRDALDEETRLKAQRLRGLNVLPSRRQLGPYLLDEWLPSIRPSVRVSTYQSYEQLVRRHVAPRLGAHELRSVTPTVLNRFYGQLLESGRLDGRGGLSAKTIRNIHLLLHKAFKDAVRWDHLLRNPCEFADPPRLTRRQAASWKPDELSAFLTSIESHRLYAAFRLAAMTGMRRGEILGLQWSDVSLDELRVSVHQTRISVAYQEHVSEPKTSHGRRSVSIDARTAAALRSHRRSQLEEQLAAGVLWAGTDYVFVGELGRPLHPDRFSKLFGQLVANADVQRITLHGLRHTHASIALAAGVHPKVVSDRLGHATVAITLDTYSHVIPSLQEEVANSVAALVDV